MARIATERVTRSLTWLGIALLVGGALVVVAGVALTTTIEGLVAAGSIAAFAFGIPGAAAFGLAMWLEYAADNVEQRAVAGLQPGHAAPGHVGEHIRKYSLAVLAVLAAWGLRIWLDTHIPDEVPFITFYLAVAVAGWIGGFGPAAAATALSATIAGVMYVHPGAGVHFQRVMLLGIFLLVSLGIAAIVSALHDALARAQQLADAARPSREVEHPLRTLAQFAPAPLFTADLAHACTYCNRAWLALRGRTLAQELGNGWCEGVHAEDLARRRDAFAAAMATRTPQSIEYRLRYADGAFRHVRDVVVANVDGRGNVVGILGATYELPAANVSANEDGQAIAQPRA
jgi:PAS domain S-box-containing protein